MKKVLNGMVSVLKLILLFASFVLTFYIVMAMYQRLEKNIIDALDIFIPYVVLLILLLLNHVLGQKNVTSNIFYNITCCLVFSLFIFVSYRTMFDNHMILSLKNSYNMSFQFFSDMISPFKALLYLLIMSNVCLIIVGIISKKEVQVADKNNSVKQIKSEDVSKKRNGQKSNNKTKTNSKKK